MVDKNIKQDDYSTMSRDELIEFCRRLYVCYGIDALSYASLRKYGGLYHVLYNVGLSQKNVIEILGLSDEYSRYKSCRPIARKDGSLVERWTWDRIINIAKYVAEQHAHLPAAGWFVKNGYGSLVQSVYYLGKSWEMVRHEINSFESSSFVQSRNGLRWRSRAEACLSNFLYARGIEHKRGVRYPDNYSDFSSANYAYYDMHFMSIDGRWINVEIWGDKPNGHQEDKYAEKRKDKENFHSGDKFFLGLHYLDCYVEERLTLLLTTYINVVDPFVFDKPMDLKVHSVHWSNADELLAACRDLADSMPDGKFPTEEWLRKRGKWENRSGDAYNTMSVYIKQWLGGVRNLRDLLGQGDKSTIVWSRDLAVKAYRDFYEKWMITPQQARNCAIADDLGIGKDDRRKAINICAAVTKYCDGVKSLNKELGIVLCRPTKWNRDRVIDGYRQVIKKWGVTPQQLKYDCQNGLVVLSSEDFFELSSLVGITGRYFSGSNEVCNLLGFVKPSRKRRPRRVKKILDNGA